MSLSPFVQAELPPEYKDPRAFMNTFGCSYEQAVEYVVQMMRETLVINDVYQVSISQVHYAKNWPPTIHLSIKRIDKEPVHDWRDLQEIKNMLVGPEHDAIEIYPAESKLVDMANQYHLWVFANPEDRLPIGWQTRMVADTQLAASVGGKQRSFT